MVSTTYYYLELQRIFIEQADKDKTKMKVLLAAITTERNIDLASVDADQFSLFCKNSSQIEVLEMRKIS